MLGFFFCGGIEIHLSRGGLFGVTPPHVCACSKLGRGLVDNGGIVYHHCLNILFTHYLITINSHWYVLCDKHVQYSFTNSWSIGQTLNTHIFISLIYSKYPFPDFLWGQSRQKKNTNRKYITCLLYIKIYERLKYRNIPEI